MMETNWIVSSCNIGPTCNSLLHLQFCLASFLTNSWSVAPVGHSMTNSRVSSIFVFSQTTSRDYVRANWPKRSWKVMKLSRHRLQASVQITWQIVIVCSSREDSSLWNSSLQTIIALFGNNVTPLLLLFSCYRVEEQQLTCKVGSRISRVCGSCYGFHGRRKNKPRRLGNGTPMKQWSANKPN